MSDTLDNLRSKTHKLAKALRRRLKQNEFLFNLRRRFVDRDLQAQRRLMHTSTTKTPAQIKAEMKAYADYWHCAPDDYIRYGLFDRELPLEEILDYVPMHYYYCDFFNSHYDRPDIDMSIFNDKLRQYLFFTERGIKVAEVVAVCRNKRLSDLGGKAMSAGELAGMFADGDRVFFKPVDGCGGAGIVVGHCRDKAIFIGDKALTDDTIATIGLDGAVTYLVQRGIRQIKVLEEINPSSFNTLRTIVSYTDGSPRIVGIILRIGRAGSEVDNSTAGGVSIAVDPDTGRFGKHAVREHGAGTFTAHPDTGYVFDGRGIDNWPEVKQKILNLISKVDKPEYIGWDIALATDGVYALEYNIGFGIEHAQVTLGGMRRQLGITPPNP